MNPIVFEIAASALTFIVMWVLLGKMIFTPFFKLLEEREARTTGDESQAIEKRARAKVLQTQIDEKLREARVQGISLRDTRVGRAKEEAQAILGRATEQAEQEIAKAQAHILELKTKAMAELPAEAEKLAKLVVDRTLAAETARTIH